MESQPRRRLFWLILRLVGLRWGPAAVIPDPDVLNRPSKRDDPDVRSVHANCLSDDQLKFRSNADADWTCSGLQGVL